MHKPLERKFNEYVDTIHKILHNDTGYLNVPDFTNQLLDRIDSLKKNFKLMIAIVEDVGQYQVRLDEILVQLNSIREWIEKCNIATTTISPLKETFFMLDDMFQTSKNLINSIYPVS